MLKRIFILIALSSCGPVDGTIDASVALTDSGSLVMDGGQTDAGLNDAGNTDSGFVFDAGADSGLLDSGVFDSGTVDAGVEFDSGVSDAGRTDAGIGSGIVIRIVTMCLTGAVDQSSASNDSFTAICNELDAKDSGVVRSGMNTTFATFPNANADNLVAPLFAALDKNGDAQANALDGPTQLNLIGFSWGGVNAGSLSTKISTDVRINQNWLYTRLIILDAYQVGVSKVTAPPTVDQSFSFRHSIAPSNDCSAGVFLGPYKGARLACASTQLCFDYDFSLAPNVSFNNILGRNVGHCDVPLAAHRYVVDLVTKGMMTTAPPPSVAVTP
jgi:hypothetical protein